VRPLAAGRLAGGAGLIVLAARIYERAILHVGAPVEPLGEAWARPSPRAATRQAATTSAATASQMTGMRRSIPLTMRRNIAFCTMAPAIWAVVAVVRYRRQGVDPGGG
jgi:hypothetical protein